jgi:GNAT superfamily N-acetyltransferase
MLIRPATPNDSEVIAVLLAELGYPMSADAVPGRLRALDSDGGAVFVAVGSDDAPIGVAAVTSHEAFHAALRVAYITALVTSSAARGRGVGRALVDACESWARETGCSRLSVTSAEHRADAHAFYPKCGMPYTGRRFAKILAPKS